MEYDKPKHTLSGQDGFSLIEVLIVIAIFSIGILSSMSMQISAVNLNAGTRKSTLAMEYATDTMERLMQIGASQEDQFHVDDNGSGTPDELAESELNNDGIDNDNDGAIDEADELEWHRLHEFGVGTGHTRGDNNNDIIVENVYYDSIFNLTWTITDIDCDGVAPNDAKRVDMTVTWDNGQKSVQLTNIRTSIL